MSLFLFDVDGTLIVSFLRAGAPRSEYDRVEVLPGRVERLRELVGAGHDVALVTNQAGVAMAYQTPEQVVRKMSRVLRECGLGLLSPGVCSAAAVRPAGLVRPRVYVSYGHPKPRLASWLDETDWRKPGAGMIRQATSDYGVGPDETTFVGDMASDREAAANAGVNYVDAAEFFGVLDRDG